MGVQGHNLGPVAEELRFRRLFATALLVVGTAERARRLPYRFVQQSERVRFPLQKRPQFRVLRIDGLPVKTGDRVPPMVVKSRRLCRGPVRLVRLPIEERRVVAIGHGRRRRGLDEQGGFDPQCGGPLLGKNLQRPPRRHVQDHRNAQQGGQPSKRPTRRPRAPVIAAAKPGNHHRKLRRRKGASSPRRERKALPPSPRLSIGRPARSPKARTRPAIRRRSKARIRRRAIVAASVRPRPRRSQRTAELRPDCPGKEGFQPIVPLLIWKRDGDAGDSVAGAVRDVRPSP